MTSSSKCRQCRYPDGLRHTQPAQRCPNGGGGNTRSEEDAKGKLAGTGNKRTMKRHLPTTDARSDGYGDGRTYRPSVPFPSVFRRIGPPRLEEPTFLLLLPPLGDGVVAMGVAGNGFTVAEDRALSVLELVTELKREIGSFLVMVTFAVTRRRAVGHCCSSTGRVRV